MCHHPSFPFWHFCCFVCCAQLWFSILTFLLLFLFFCWYYTYLLRYKRVPILSSLLCSLSSCWYYLLKYMKVPIPSSLSWFSSSCWYYLLKYKWVPTPSSFLLMFHCPLDCNVLLEFLMVSLWLHVFTSGCSCASADYVALLLVSTKW